MADPQHEQALRWHKPVMLRPNLLSQKVSVFGDRVTLRHFQGRPKLVLRAGSGRVGRAQYDMAGKRIGFKQVIKRAVQLVRRNLPGDQRPLCQIGRHQGLPHPAYGPGSEHGLNPGDNRIYRNTGPVGNLSQRVGRKALNRIF